MRQPAAAPWRRAASRVCSQQAPPLGCGLVAKEDDGAAIGGPKPSHAEARSSLSSQAFLRGFGPSGRSRGKCGSPQLLIVAGAPPQASTRVNDRVASAEARSSLSSQAFLCRLRPEWKITQQARQPAAPYRRRRSFAGFDPSGRSRCKCGSRQLSSRGSPQLSIVAGAPPQASPRVEDRAASVAAGSYPRAAARSFLSSQALLRRLRPEWKIALQVRQPAAAPGRWAAARRKARCRLRSAAGLLRRPSIPQSSVLPIPTRERAVGTHGPVGYRSSSSRATGAMSSEANSPFR